MRNAQNAKREKSNRAMETAFLHSSGYLQYCSSIPKSPRTPRSRMYESSNTGRAFCTSRHIDNIIERRWGIKGKRYTLEFQRYMPYLHQNIVDTCKCRTRRLQRLPPAQPSLISAKSTPSQAICHTSLSLSPIVFDLHVNNTGVAHVELLSE